MKIELANFLLEESRAFFAALQLYVRAEGADGQGARWMASGFEQQI